jgi:hypothetical protein
MKSSWSIVVVALATTVQAVAIAPAPVAARTRDFHGTNITRAQAHENIMAHFPAERILTSDNLEVYFHNNRGKCGLSIIKKQSVSNPIS